MHDSLNVFLAAPNKCGAGQQRYRNRPDSPNKTFINMQSRTYSYIDHLFHDVIPHHLSLTQFVIFCLLLVNPL